jgi:hypothetical protein
MLNSQINPESPNVEKKENELTDMEKEKLGYVRHGDHFHPPGTEIKC